MSLRPCSLFCKAPSKQSSKDDARAGTRARPSFESDGGQATNPRGKAERRYPRIEKRKQEAAGAQGSLTPHLVRTRTKDSKSIPSPPPRAGFRRIVKRAHLGRSGMANPSAGPPRLGRLGGGSCSASSLSSRRVAVPFPKDLGGQYKGGVRGPGSVSWRARYGRRQRVRRLPFEGAPPRSRPRHFVWVPNVETTSFIWRRFQNFQQKHF
jgi:hypothetical protein